MRKFRPTQNPSAYTTPHIPFRVVPVVRVVVIPVAAKKKKKQNTRRDYKARAPVVTDGNAVAGDDTHSDFLVDTLPMYVDMLSPARACVGRGARTVRSSSLGPIPFTSPSSSSSSARRVLRDGGPRVDGTAAAAHTDERRHGPPMATIAGRFPDERPSSSSAVAACGRAPSA